MASFGGFPLHIKQTTRFMALVAISIVAHVSYATIVERIVAVVGERAILLSELRKRAKPLLMQIYKSPTNPATRAAQETQVYRELLDRMIDDMLSEQAATRSNLAVSSTEIDRAIRAVAEGQKLSPAALLKAAEREGFSEADYREELRRQVLHGKLVQLRILQRVRVGETDMRAAYARWRKKMEEGRPVDLRIIALRLDMTTTEAQRRERERLAADISRRARAGEDFCQLVTRHSDDVSTKSTCGSSGPHPFSDLLPVLQDTVNSLNEGETSLPVFEGADAILVVQLAKTPPIPDYDSVKPLMRDEAMRDIVDRQWKTWLQEQRRNVYIDVRL
ncbi:SurA N-terminal domain-containing protein [Pendulispora rubella]|uniref:SurA N-terminal domain-containing protein n=1 Tax=Pendulispora rubella TaxID=2741070 RepID=A0ABZ2LFJ5_9BACT